MNLIDCGNKLRVDDLIALENKLDIALSADYKKFMLENNGGTFDKMIGVDFIEVDPVTKKCFDQNTDVQYFYDIDEVLSTYYNLIEEEVILEKYIPFACDSCGNELLICSDSSEDNGKIYFANHEMYEIETEQWIKTEVASSFNVFIENLKEITVD